MNVDVTTNGLARHPPLRVLLVDDDEDQYVLTKELLDGSASWEFEIDWAANFDDGLRLLESARYDVALIDYRLGEHNGVELIRSDIMRSANVPAIMLTGDRDTGIDFEAMAAGAVDFVVKSEVTAPMLKRALRYAVEGHRVLTLFKQREGSLRALLEDSGDVILLVDRTGTIVFASDSVGHIEGCASSDMLGTNAFERVQSDDVDRVRDAFESCACERVGRTIAEYREQHRDGGWRWREAALAEREAEYRATFDEAPVGIAHTSLDGRWLQINESGRALFGYDAAPENTCEALRLPPIRHGHS